MGFGERRDYLRIALDMTEEKGSPQGELRLVIVSQSMAPLLQPGDAVLVRPQKRYLTGDILAYRSHGQVVTHRLIAQDSGRLILKGDRARRADPPVEPEAVLGRMVALERGGVRQAAPASGRNAWAGRLSRWEAGLFGALSGSRPSPWRQRLAALACTPLRVLITRLAIKWIR